MDASKLGNELKESMHNLVKNLEGRDIEMRAFLASLMDSGSDVPEVIKRRAEELFVKYFSL